MDRDAQRWVEGACRQAVSRLRATFEDRLVALALYGSAARDPAGPWNDLDFYALIEGLPADLVLRDRAVDASLGTLDPPFRRSVLARTPAEFEADVTPLMLDVALDARVLWDPGATFGARLARLRQIVQGAGLHREAHPGGFIWRFETPPRGDWVLDWEGYREIAA